MEDDLEKRIADLEGRGADFDGRQPAEPGINEQNPFEDPEALRRGVATWIRGHWEIIAIAALMVLGASLTKLERIIPAMNQPAPDWVGLLFLALPFAAVVNLLRRAVHQRASTSELLNRGRTSHLRSAVGARRAIPRRIHGVRLAITSTARSERRIAVRGPGVGIDTSSASADPARAPWRSTARSCQVPGTPRNSTLPRSRSPCPSRPPGPHGAGDENSPAPACSQIRAAMCTAIHRCGIQQFALASVDASADSIPSVSASARRASAQRMACVGPSNW